MAKPTRNKILKRRRFGYQTGSAVNRMRNMGEGPAINAYRGISSQQRVTRNTLMGGGYTPGNYLGDDVGIDEV